MSDQHHDGPPISEDAAEIAATLSARGEKPAKKAKPVKPKKPKRTRAQKKKLALNISRWTGTGVLVVAGVVMLGMSGSITSAHQKDVTEKIALIQAEKDRGNTATYDIEDLPDTQDAKRWIEQVNTGGEQVAQFQTTFLRETGPLDMSKIPTKRPGFGEEDVCTPHLPVDNSVRQGAYTEKERTTCATQIRTDAVSGLSRSLRPYFQVSSLDGAFDPTQKWQEHVSTLVNLGDEASLKDYRWEFQPVTVFNENGTFPLAWILYDKDDQQVAWVSAVYDPISKKMTDAKIATNAVGGEK